MGREDTIVLFDVDGTLTVPMKQTTQEMLDVVKELRKHCTVGIVGGSDLAKQKHQLGDDLMEHFDYVFSQNGLDAYKDGKLIGQESFRDFLGEEKLKKLINFILHQIADIDIPIKRGTFVEYRTGMLNVSPIGRNCARNERDDFEKYDKEHKIREKMVKELQEKFKDFNLRYSIGGQISMDIFPEGWDKTYCLRYLKDFKTIHFFGDKTFQGGNDYEIYTHKDVIGHSVTDYHDTIKQLKETFKL